MPFRLIIIVKSSLKTVPASIVTRLMSWRPPGLPGCGSTEVRFSEKSFRQIGSFFETSLFFLFPDVSLVPSGQGARTDILVVKRDCDEGVSEK